MKAPQRFKRQDFYAILSLPRTASTQDINHAYRRLALRVHPDVNSSETASEEFAYLSHVHQVLSDEKRRRIYDQCGEDEEGVQEVSEESINYWRCIFPKFTTADIDAYHSSYIDSEEELEDIVKAFNDYEGDLNAVYESVPFASASSMQRIVDIINREIPTAKISKKKVSTLIRRLKQKESEEASEAEEALQLLNEEERKLIKSNQEGKGKQLQLTNGEDALRAIIAARQAKRHNDMFTVLEAKYAKHCQNNKSKGPMPTDQEFEALQAKLLSKQDNKENKRNNQSKRKKVKA